MHCSEEMEPENQRRFRSSAGFESHTAAKCCWKEKISAVTVKRSCFVAFWGSAAESAVSVCKKDGGAGTVRDGGRNKKKRKMKSITLPWKNARQWKESSK